MSENPIFSYTKRDYERSRKEGLSKIPIISKGSWTDLNATDPGIIILDYVHALVDMMNYYQDHQALESFISTAKERSNIFRLAKQLSYKIRSAKGATCVVTFDCHEFYDYIVKIPKYTQVSTEDGISYLTKEDAFLNPHTHIVNILCSQGTRKSIDYKGTGISRFSAVTNASNQSVRLVDEHIDIDSIEITDSLGRTWTPVDYIVFSTAQDRAYQVELNPDDSVTIRFGDGERGIVPREEDLLTITYTSTKAEEGNIGSRAITKLVSTIRGNRSDPIIFSVYNNSASVGGTQSQSSREIRELAPGVIKSQDRAVTLNDFENLAKMVEGVKDAKAYDINNKPDMLHHEVSVLITPTDNTVSLEQLTSKVYDYLYKRMIPPTNLQILIPSIVPIDITIDIKSLDTVSPTRLKYNIQEVVESYFNDRAGAIDDPFYPSELYAKIQNITGVRYVSMTPNAPVECPELSSLSLGSLTINID